MANLPETPQWEEGVYQIEVSDPVLGGPDGISNRQAKQLASRTSYLKQQVEKGGSDLEKHIAAADPHTQYAPKASPTFTGNPAAPTVVKTDNSTKLATTAHVKTVVADYAPLASPGLTGIPTAPTAAQTVNNTQLATTAFVKAALAALVASSPAALDTLNELAAALGNDPNFATTMTNALAGKQPLDNTLTALSGKSVAALLEYLGLGELPDSFGDAASKNVGTTAGTVAAGDDSRIVNAVQPSNPGLCTAWVNFNGNNPATIRSSFNVSSVTRLSTGKYQIIFGTPMENPDYAVSLTIGDGATSGTATPIVAINGSSTTGDPVKKDTGGINITTRGSGGVYECSEVNAIFFGGK